jgi:DnaK suppressor protein
MSNEQPKLDLEFYRNALELRRVELLEVMTGTSVDRAPVELDQTMQGRLSRIDAMQQREMALAAQRRREIQILRIDNALDRIQSHDYGFCVSCDEVILAARLKLDLSEPLCITCASRNQN